MCDRKIILNEPQGIMKCLGFFVWKSPWCLLMSLKCHSRELIYTVCQLLECVLFCFNFQKITKNTCGVGGWGGTALLDLYPIKEYLLIIGNKQNHVALQYL